MHQLSQLPTNTQERVGTKSKNDLHKAIPKSPKELSAISNGVTQFKETYSKTSSTKETQGKGQHLIKQLMLTTDVTKSYHSHADAAHGRNTQTKPKFYFRPTATTERPCCKRKLLHSIAQQ